MPDDGERRLAAIMFTDVVGYTALTQRNESETVRLLEEHRRLIRPYFPSHGGREIKTIGDAFLVEFPSALDAVLCAVAIQQTMHDRKIARGDTLSLRIGIHVGDVMESGNDILGDAVNIASRIEPLSEPGGICITEEVYRQVRNKSDLSFISIGETPLKNVSSPVEVFKAMLPWEKPATPEGATFPSNRIAILPFTSFSPDPNDAYFADGITDEIISAAAGISGLKVISRTSVVGYKGTTKKVREIGMELEVGSILEGSFKKAGNKIRVTTQLINVADDEHLWAQNYDRNLDDVFEVQSDVAKQVAEALRVKILVSEKERIEKRPTENTLAYALYLKGRSLWNTRRLEDLKTAVECFAQAVHEDPNFAPGYAGQADCFILLRKNWRIDREENLTKARATAERALRLDPALAEAYATLGFVYREEYDLRRAEEAFKKAIELKPGYATAHQWYYWVLRSQLRWDQALEEIKTAAELDPLSGVIALNFGDYYFSRREFGKAVEKYRIAVELGGDVNRGSLAAAYGMLKMDDRADEEMDAAAKFFKGIMPSIADATTIYKAYFKDDKETVRKLLPELEAHLKETNVTATSIAELHFYLGEVDEGFKWLEKAHAGKEADLLDIQWDWDFDGIRSDPRYVNLLKRLGLE